LKVNERGQKKSTMAVLWVKSRNQRGGNVLGGGKKLKREKGPSGKKHSANDHVFKRVAKFPNCADQWKSEPCPNGKGWGAGASVTSKLQGGRGSVGKRKKKTLRRTFGSSAKGSREKKPL